MGASTSTPTADAGAQDPQALPEGAAEEVGAQPPAPPPESNGGLPSTTGPADVAGSLPDALPDAGDGGLGVAYAELLVQARGEDFRDLEELKFIQVGGQDDQGRTCVMVVGRYLPCSVIDVERVRRFLYRELDPVVAKGAFVILYVHTGTSWKESPGVFWLRDLYLKLPGRYHDRMQRLYVLHPALAIWAAMWVVGPQWTPSWIWSGLGDLFWKKLEWVSRVEFLWDHVPRRAVPELPDFVAEHDAVLEDAPLVDYGLAPTSTGGPGGAYGGMPSMPSTLGGAPPIM